MLKKNQYHIFNGYLYEFIYITNTLNYLFHLINKINKDDLEYDQKENYKKNFDCIIQSLKFLNGQDKILKDIIYNDFNNNPSIINMKLLDFYVVIFEKMLNEYEINFNREILIKNISVVMNLGVQNSISFVKNLILHFNNEKEEKLSLDVITDFFCKYHFKTIYFNIDFHYKVLDLFDEKISIIFKDTFGFTKEELSNFNSISGHFINSDLLIQINKENENYEKVKEIINIDLSFDNHILLNIDSSNNKDMVYFNYLKTKEKNILKEINTIKLESLTLNVKNNYEFLEGVWGTDTFDNFIKNDKSFLKLIQSTSYVNSYINYLSEKNIYKKNKVQLKIFATTSSKVNSINIKDNFDKLKNKINVVGNRYSTIKENIKDDEKELEEETYINKKINNFLYKQFKYDDYCFSKKLTNFNNTNLDLRTLHTIEFRKRYKDGFKVIDLLGNPGIGKTTSLVSVLYELDNFCVVYLSSRTAVNLDIFNKVIDDVNNIFSNAEAKKIYNIKDNIDLEEYNKDVICLTTNQKLKDDFKIMLNKQETCDILNEKLQMINKNNISYIKDEEDIVINTGSHILETNSETQTSVKKGKGNSHTVFEYISERIKDISEHTNHKRIVATMALQGYNNQNLLFKLLSFLEVISKNGIKNVIFMTDELTGAEQTSTLIQDLLTTIFKNDDKNNIIQKTEFILRGEKLLIPSDLDIRIINADASISNEDALNKYLTTTFSNPNILFKKLTSDEIEVINNLPKVYTLKHQSLIIKPGHNNTLNLVNNNSCLINVNSFPANELTIKYIYNNKKNEDFYSLKTFNEVSYSERKVESKQRQVDEIFDFFNYKIDTDESIIYYLQNKNVLKDFKNLLISDTRLQFLFNTKEELEKSILLIDGNSLKEKSSQEDLKNLSKFRIFLITSTVSRGISFKNVTKIVMEVPEFDKESQLNELIQTIYRGRGGKYDTSYKELVFFLNNKLDDDNMVSKLDFIQNLFLIQGMIENRIKGYYNYGLGEGYYNIIPNSSIGIKKKEESNYNTDFMEAIKTLSKEKHNTKEVSEILDDFKKIVEITVLWLGLESYNKEVDDNKEIIKQLKKYLTIDNPIYNIFSLKELENNEYMNNFYDFFSEFDNEGTYLTLKTKTNLNINNKVLDYNFLLDLERKLKIIMEYKYFNKYLYKKELDIVNKVITIFINNNKGKGHEISEKKDISFEFIFFLDFLIYFKEDLINNSFEGDFSDLLEIMDDASRVFFKTNNRVLPFSLKNINFKNDGVPFIAFKNSHIKNIINEKYNNHYISNINSIVFLNIINSKVSNV